MSNGNTNNASFGLLGRLIKFFIRHGKYAIDGDV